MALRSLTFSVPGAPAPQGSKRAFVINGKAVMTDADKNLKPWRAAVSSAAAEARGDQDLFGDAVRLRVRFVFPRPKSHYGTGKNATVLKTAAPTHVTKAPDVDKLVRAVGDALTGVIYRDDSQVSSVEAVKVYGAYSCAYIEVTPLQD